MAKTIKNAPSCNIKKCIIKYVESNQKTNHLFLCSWHDFVPHFISQDSEISFHLKHKQDQRQTSQTVGSHYNRPHMMLQTLAGWKDTGDGSLELLQANAAWYNSCVAGSFPAKQQFRSCCSGCISLYFYRKAFWVTYILTSQDFSWLQNGQVNWMSRLPVIFFLGGGFLFDFLRPISGVVYLQKKQLNNSLFVFFGFHQVWT